MPRGSEGAAQKPESGRSARLEGVKPQITRAGGGRRGWGFSLGTALSWQPRRWRAQRRPRLLPAEITDPPSYKTDRSSQSRAGPV